MEQCSCCRCNRECERPAENRCSCQKEKATCEKVQPIRESFCQKARNVAEIYDCPETANDEVGNMPIAMAYVPWQQWGDVFTGECGLAHGTVFPELIKPWWICCGQR